MGRDEAVDVLSRRVEELRSQPYAALRDRWLHSGEGRTVVADDGVEYQVETHAVWDDAKGGDLRVIVSVDGGGVSAFRPMLSGFVKAPDDTLVEDVRRPGRPEPGMSYDVVGATQVAQGDWTARVAGFRRFERTVDVGPADDWEKLSQAVLHWAVKTRSGFTVHPGPGASLRVRTGDDVTTEVGVGPWTVTEPVRVVAVVETSQRCGFAYGTRPGHPVRGEEAFVLHRSDDRVLLTLRSLTRAGDGPWAMVFPILLLAQRRYRRRYARALQEVSS